MKHSFFLAALTCLAVLASCSTLKRKSKEIRSTATQANINNLKEELESRQDYQYLSLKGIMEFEDQDISTSAQVTLQSKKDSIILLSLRKLGFEVARALINPDSIVIIDRINHSWAKLDIDEWSQKLNIPIDFYGIQDILISGVHLPDGPEYFLQQHNDTVLITGQFENYKLQSSLLAEGFFPLNTSFQRSEKKAQMIVKELYKLDKFLIPSNLQLTYDEEHTEIQYIKLKWSEMHTRKIESFKFTIPASYTNETR
ncbi:MAG: DUF4292 domain-containing protein [Saprospiraceae bacterium]|nr:DUF4292 domain-containing protein [Candidatus Vicinibacter affinis]MBK9641313.1 DUF4292 domain-containing protein [Candidatus Vicinibacter affinis]